MTNEVAARWLVRLESGPLSADEQRELDQWLDTAPHHRGALIRARAVWADLDRVASVAGTETAGDGPPNRMVRALGESPWRMAASVGAVAVAAGLLLVGTPRLLDRGELLHSGVGDVRRIALDDGSGVTLNSNTRVRVRYEPDARRLELQRGEALFEVAKDPDRPFIVSSGELTVRAVGTAFAVRVTERDVNVTVTEGVVEVASRSEPPTKVTVHQRATTEDNSKIVVQPIEPEVAERQLAWREGLLSFAGETLAAAVSEVNRHGRQQIVIEDPVLAANPVVGVFRVGDIRGFAQTAAAALGAEVQPDGDIIRLRLATAPQPN